MNFLLTSQDYMNQACSSLSTRSVQNFNIPVSLQALICLLLGQIRAVLDAKLSKQNLRRYPSVGPLMYTNKLYSKANCLAELFQMCPAPFLKRT